MPADIRGKIRDYDGDFNAEKPEGAGNRRPRLDSLADGEYEFCIVEAFTDLAGNQPVVRLALQCGDRVVEHTMFLSNQVGANVLGAMLVDLGVPADRWKAQGKLFSEELPGALRQIVGTGFVGKKVTKQDKGKDYARVYVNQVLGHSDSFGSPDDEVF